MIKRTKLIIEIVFLSLILVLFTPAETLSQDNKSFTHNFNYTPEVPVIIKQYVK